MDIHAIPHLRLVNQHIASARLKTPSEAVNWLAAVQAQDFAGATWAVGLRVPGAVEADIEQAFNAGAILRTHVLRPTWHFVTPPDIRWLLALTAPRVHAVNAGMYRQLELDRAFLKRSHALLVKALRGGRQLTRDELRGALQQAGLTADGLRLAYIVMSAELDGLLCSGARRGKQFTYALLEERAPPARAWEREAALAELARRFFLSRGPATVADLAKWSGLTLADARRGLEDTKAQFQSALIDGQTYWFSPAAPAAPAAAPSAHLLSIYDEYISGYKDRGAIGAAEVGAKLIALGNALRFIILVDGQIVGVWKRTLGREAVAIETNLFRPLSKAENQAVAAAARRYGAFVGRPITLT